MAHTHTLTHTLINYKLYKHHMIEKYTITQTLKKQFYRLYILTQLQYITKHKFSININNLIKKSNQIKTHTQKIQK